MVNYANGKIYKIECLTTGLIYIGSTTKDRLSQRLVQHRCDYKKYKDGNYYFVTSFKVLENDNYIIGLLESVNCNTKDELLAREGHYIKTLDCVNKHKMGRTKKEYYQDNKEHFLEKQNLYHEANKEKINEMKRTKHVCECGSNYTNASKPQHLKSIKHQNYINSQI